MRSTWLLRALAAGDSIEFGCADRSRESDPLRAGGARPAVGCAYAKRHACMTSSSGFAPNESSAAQRIADATARVPAGLHQPRPRTARPCSTPRATSRPVDFRRKRTLARHLATARRRHDVVRPAILALSSKHGDGIIVAPRAAPLGRVSTGGRVTAIARLERSRSPTSLRGSRSWLALLRRAPRRYHETNTGFRSDNARDRLRRGRHERRRF
jgi:hypothetical protein